MILVTSHEFRSIREQLNLTQAQLADSLDVQPNTVARWERGELPISRVTEFALRYLQVKQKKRAARKAQYAGVNA